MAKSAEFTGLTPEWCLKQKSEAARPVEDGPPLSVCPEKSKAGAPTRNHSFVSLVAHVHVVAADGRVSACEPMGGF